MTNIKLVIKIPEEVYKDITENGFIYDEDNEVISHVVKNGTPLPKGHGDLVDVGQCNRRLFYKQCGGADALITVKTAFDMLMALPMIMHADKE